MISSSTGGAASTTEPELPHQPGAIRGFFGRHPRLVDGILTLIYAVPFGAFGISRVVVSPSAGSIVFLVSVIGAGIALFYRRRHPIQFFCVAALALVSTGLISDGPNSVPLFLALYALAVYRSSRDAWLGYTVTILCVIVIALSNRTFFSLGDELTKSAVTVPLLTGVVTFWGLVSVLIGTTVGARRRYLDALIERAKQLARERDQQAQIAATAERNRIAGEMHDIVSHSLTVMITLSDGTARQIASDPLRAIESAERAAQVGRGALADLRRTLGVLRQTNGGEDVVAPQPGVSQLNELVERFRSAGLPVRITITGTPPTDMGAQLTIYRVVQEGLTNVLRYAPGATTVTVDLTFDTRIRITVNDNSTENLHGENGTGHGLIGLQERVLLYGGKLDAGPRRQGGWHLGAEFPMVYSPTDTKE